MGQIATAGLASLKPYLDNNGIASKYSSSHRIEDVVERVVPWNYCSHLHIGVVRLQDCS